MVLMNCCRSDVSPVYNSDSEVGRQILLANISDRQVNILNIKLLGVRSVQNYFLYLSSMKSITGPI